MHALWNGLTFSNLVLAGRLNLSLLSSSAWFTCTGPFSCGSVGCCLVRPHRLPAIGRSLDLIQGSMSARKVARQAPVLAACNRVADWAPAGPGVDR